MIDYLRAHLKRELYNVQLSQLERWGHVLHDDCVTECICMACRWLTFNVEGCVALEDDEKTPERLAESIASACEGTGVTVEKGHTGTFWRVVMPRTRWVIYRFCDTGGRDVTKLRLDCGSVAFGMPHVPLTNRVPDILRYVDAIVPEFDPLIEEAARDARKTYMKWTIWRTASEARKDGGGK